MKPVTDPPSDVYLPEKELQNNSSRIKNPFITADVFIVSVCERLHGA